MEGRITIIICVVLCFLSTIRADNYNTICYDSSTGSYDVATCLTNTVYCDQDIFTDLPLLCEPPIVKNPTHNVEAPLTAGTWYSVANVYGNSYSNITDLIQGSTYYFSTCRLSSDGSDYYGEDLTGFDPLIVIRDPNNNFLVGNYYCLSCDSNFPGSALAAYTHTSSSYNYIYVSVYYDNTANDDTTCARLSPFPVTLYQSVSVTEDCTPYLAQVNSSIDLDGYTSVTIDDTDLYNYGDLCVSEDVQANITTVSCSNLGVNPVLITASGSPSVVSYLTVTDSVAPVVDCASQIIINGSLVYEDYCQQNPYYPGLGFLYNCFVKISNLPFYSGVTVTDSCPTTVTYQFDQSNPLTIRDYVTVGDTPSVTYTVTDAASNVAVPQDCTLFIQGAYIVNIKSGESFYSYPYYYDIYFTASLPSVSNYDSAILFLSAVGEYGIPYYTFENNFEYLIQSYDNILSSGITISIEVDSENSVFDFNDVVFPVLPLGVDHTFRLGVMIYDSDSHDYFLSYASPIIYIHPSNGEEL